MKRLVSVMAVAGALLAGGWTAEVSAYSAGIFDQAEPGCTCHGPQIAVPSTRIFITGLPDGADPSKPTGYVPGESYDIQVLVLGLSVPPSGAGFNLHASTAMPNVPAGDIVSADESAKVRRETECERMESYFGCFPGNPGNDCKLTANPDCPVFDPANSACAKCTSTDPLLCRVCDASTILDIQATHTQPKSFPFTWSFTWTAPPAGTGTVTFHLAANVVNGDGTTSLQDLWSMLGADPLQPVIMIPEGETPPLLPIALPVPPVALPAH